MLISILSIRDLPVLSESEEYRCFVNDDPCLTCREITPTFTAPDDAYTGEHRHIPIVSVENRAWPSQGLAMAPLDSFGFPDSTEVQLITEG